MSHDAPEQTAISKSLNQAFINISRAVVSAKRTRPAVADRRYAQRPRHLRLLERDVHTVGGQVKSQPAGLGVQIDDHAIFVVLELGEGAALNDRHAGCERRIVATEIRRTGQIVDLTLCIKSGGAY